MKRKIEFIITFLLASMLSAFVFVGCNQKGQAKAQILSKTETMVVIQVNETQGFATLLDAMTYLQNEGKLTFELSGGMVSSIEGKTNPVDLSACWMLYTSDTEMSNAEWGTIDYDGNTYASAILGAESLEVSAGNYYIWSYVIF